ncbi:tetratricopeptide repeat protein [Actinokineospora enzanensis]|uniref:tetratricopeptide repeat protein n=1 Tax=Actinokineospora enzanensis TaxID=155975 RepID=UPI00037529B6|nr:tetratricopeptide repeat protein [Actinokineospora enzanensis]
MLSGLGTAKARKALAGLHQVSLVELVGPGRYRAHDMLRLFAIERISTEESGDTRTAAVRAVITWYLASAANADRLFDVKHPEILGIAGPGMEFSDATAAMDWLHAERTNLVACVHQAAEWSLHDLAWRLAATLFEYFYRTKMWSDWIGTHTTGLASARTERDRHGVATMLSRLGVAHRERYEHELAEDCFREALSTWEELKYAVGVAWVAGRYAQACRERGRLDEAAVLCLRGLHVAEQTADRQEQGVIHNNLSGIYRDAGHLDEALEHSTRALTAFTEVGYHRGMAWARTNAANIHRDAGRLDIALELYQQAYNQRVDLGDQYGQALTLSDMGYAQCLAGAVETGVATMRTALDLFPEDDPITRRLRARLTEFTDTIG